MPELILFAIGALVTGLAVTACLLVGWQETEDDGIDH
jgi:hypothetical protein